MEESKKVKEELLKELSIMIENIEKLPPHALLAPINHYDLASALMLLLAILRAD